MPSYYRQLRNPLPRSPENLRAGMEHFADHCSTCHANDGSGDTILGRDLYPKPPNMRTSETQEKSDGDLYYTIENGVRLSGMPAFGEHSGTSDADTWKLVTFIRHLPTLTDEELAKMGSLNPRPRKSAEKKKEEEEFLRGDNPQTQRNGSHQH